MDSRITNCRLQRTRYVVMDWLTSSVAFLLFDILRYYFFPENSLMSLGNYLSLPVILTEQLIFPFGFMVIYWISGYYNNVLEKSRLQEFITTIASAGVNSLIVYLLLLTNDFPGRRAYDYELILLLFLILFISTYIGRITLTSMVIRHYKTRRWRYNTVITGSPKEVARMKRKLEGSNHGGYYNIKGYISLNEKEKITPPERYLTFVELQEMAKNGNVDQVIIAYRNARESDIINAFQILFPLNISIKIAPDILSFITPVIRLNNVLDEPLIDLTKPSLSESSKNIKRLSDVVISIFTLITISPLLGMLALGIKLKGGKGPVFFRQQRIGLHKRPFDIYKLRTMSEDAEADGPRLSHENDPRVTPIGKWMRKYRLDELPQFWNVLKGDMSIVGPRPEREVFIKDIVKIMPQYALLHQVQPGITSWGMVKYGYAKNVQEMVKRAKFDLIYLNNMSIVMDLKIMIHTIKTILTGKGI